MELGPLVVETGASSHGPRPGSAGTRPSLTRDEPRAWAGVGSARAQSPAPQRWESHSSDRCHGLKRRLRADATFGRSGCSDAIERKALKRTRMPPTLSVRFVFLCSSIGTTATGSRTGTTQASPLVAITPRIRTSRRQSESPRPSRHVRCRRARRDGRRDTTSRRWSSRARARASRRAG